MKRLMIIADHSLVVHAIRLALRQTAGFQVVGFVDGRQSAEGHLVELRPDVVLVDDMQDPGGRARCALREVRDQAPAGEGAAAHAADGGRVARRGLRGRRRRRSSPRPCTRSRSARCCARSCRATSSSAIAASRPPARRRTARSRAASSRSCASPPRATPTAGSRSELWVTEQTVKFHLSNTYRKLGVANRTEASRYAYMHDLVIARRAAGFLSSSSSASPSRDARRAACGSRSPPRPSAPPRGRLPRGRVRALIAAARASPSSPRRRDVRRRAGRGPAGDRRARRRLVRACCPSFVAIWIGVFAAYRLYERQTHAIATSSFDEVGELFNALLAGSLLLLVVGQALKRIFDVGPYSPARGRSSSSRRRSWPFPRCAASCARGSCRRSCAPRRALIVGRRHDRAHGRAQDRRASASTASSSSASSTTTRPSAGA